MNKILLIEAIRQSNLHPTTKSFLAQVLKNVDGVSKDGEPFVHPGDLPGGEELTEEESAAGFRQPGWDDRSAALSEMMHDHYMENQERMSREVKPFNPASQTAEEKQAWLQELLGPAPKR